MTSTTPIPPRPVAPAAPQQVTPPARPAVAPPVQLKTLDASVQAKREAPPVKAPTAGNWGTPTASVRASSAMPEAARQATEGAAGGEFRTPDWVKDSVFYHIFPDRFANGDLGNDPQGTQPWGSPPTNNGFHGGDLNGVTHKMGYLTTLGVNALYLNPIFSSPSNHRYNTTDYEHVETSLGGDKAFHDMVDAAHGNGVKVVLDGVFNHTSHQHQWFQDIRDQGPKSKNFDKYDVLNWPISYSVDKEGVLRSPDYKGWWGYASLPELRTENPKVRDYFLHDQNAIAKKWITEGKIDGWRMDVADEIEHSFWKEARTAIKSANPDAYIVAENWNDASNYLKGDEFDGAMNYKYFQVPAVDYFAKKQVSTDDFVKSLHNSYPREAKLAAFNILDSHDTPRFITEAGGDWYRQRPAAIFQMTYQGAPVIYYGDELGVEGAKDPDSRRSFPWEKVPASPVRPTEARLAAHGPAITAPASAPVADAGAGAGAGTDDRSAKLFDLYRTLISVRKQEPALRRGDFAVLSTHNDDKTLSYRRSVAGEARDVLVALNNDVTNHGLTIPVSSFATDGTTYSDALSGSKYSVSGGAINIPKLDGNFGAVLVRDANAGAEA